MRTQCKIVDWQYHHQRYSIDHDHEQIYDDVYLDVLREQANWFDWNLGLLINNEIDH